MTARLPRSYLFVPGDQADMLEGALDRGADAIIVDLEDAVAPNQKESARAIVACWLRRSQQGPSEIWIRVNATEPWQNGDVELAVSQVVTGVVVPKVEAPAMIDRVARHAAVAAAVARGERPPLLVIALIESAAGQLAAPAIARSAGLRQLAAGEIDLAADLGIDPSLDEIEMLEFRMALTVASSAAGLAAPIGPVMMDITDTAKLITSSRRLARLGYRSRLLVHPAQVSPTNEVFTPEPESLARAKTLLDSYDAAIKGGHGVAVDDMGKVIDEAVARSARNLLARDHSDSP